MKNGWKIGATLAEKLGTDASEGAIARIAKWGIKKLDNPFFEVTIAANVGAFAFGQIAESLGGNTVVVDIADVVGGTFGGAVAGAVLGGKLMHCR